MFTDPVISLSLRGASPRLSVENQAMESVPPGVSMTRARTLLARLALLCASLVLALLLAEVAVRLLGVDWDLIARAAPRNIDELEVTQADPDPRLLMSLRPGARQRYDGAYTVTVNALGHRGPERSIAKEPGVFRIVVLGGSNVYGAGVNDQESWPAQLEARLQARGDGDYEVWNLGVSGYNNLQLTVVGRDAIERFDPDLVVFAPTNRGPRYHYDVAEDIGAYYQRDPTLWPEIFPPSYLLPDEGTSLMLLDKVALVRLLQGVRLLVHMRIEGGSVMPGNFLYTEEARAFLTWATQRVPVVVVGIPAVPLSQFDEVLGGLDLPAITLDATGRPPAYQEMHPTADVLGWYADHIAAELERLGLLRG